MLGNVLEGVLCQTLVPKASGKGRVPAVEIMVPTPSIRSLIREDKAHKIYKKMQAGKEKDGLVTMNQSLAALYEKRSVTLGDCLGKSPDPDELRAGLARKKPARKAVRKKTAKRR